MHLIEWQNPWLLLLLAGTALAAFCLGALLAHWRGRWHTTQWQQQIQKQAERERQLLQDQLAHERSTLQTVRAQAEQWRDALDAARDERAQLHERSARVPQLEQQLHISRHCLEQAHARESELQTRLAALETEFELEQQNAQDKLLLLQQARETLRLQFEELAQQILEEKTQRFTEQNQQKLGALLDPLRMRLQEFQGRVELFYDAEGKQRAALAQQVEGLLQMNHKLSDEARHLAQALKGSSKAQGNWGEVLLERLLEQAGLRQGQDYRLQASFTQESGARAQPDVVLHLPHNRHLIVDAKVSLTAYEQLLRLPQDEANEVRRKAALRQHIDSIRKHIKELSHRNYQNLDGLQTTDFVIMFVPIEPAFMLALGEDDALSQYAWERNVLLASPSTLLFVLRTIAHLWRQEAQTRNAQEIARRGAELYDKLAAFVADLEKVGQQLRLAQNSYDAALGKLSQQRGNLIHQAEILKELGVRPAKALPAALVEQALEADKPGTPNPSARNNVS